MQTNKRKRRLPRFARGFAVLCAALAAAAAGSASAAPTETVLHAFRCLFPRCPGGNSPFAGLIADSAGNLYGTTEFGGTSNYGVVFKLSLGRIETELHAFTGSDGGSPQAGLIADSAGNLYGTTSGGGASRNGVVFKLAPPISPAQEWTETVLYSFCSLPGCGDGATPLAGLIADGAGNLYGTTSGGGASNAGVVFKLSPGGTETVLYSFCSLPGCSDGSYPSAGLIADSAGNLYGTTNQGGGSGCFGLGCGVVFKLSPGGTETVLHSFCSLPGCGDGANPAFGSLIADGGGNLYGTTEIGGASNDGGVFKLAPPISPAQKWTETVLHSFCSLPGCGALPVAGLIADSAGNLYGTTQQGTSGNGVVFKLAGTGFVPPVPSAPSAASLRSPSAGGQTPFPLN